MADLAKIELIVLKAKHLQIKGSKSLVGMDTYVIMSLGKEQYRTETMKQDYNPVWNQDCLFEMPSNKGKSIEVSVFQKNSVGLDKRIGKVLLPIDSLCNKMNSTLIDWFTLHGKDGGQVKPSSNSKVAYRGEIKLQISFIRNHSLGHSQSVANNLVKSTTDLAFTGNKKSPSVKRKMSGVFKRFGSLANIASVVEKDVKGNKETTKLASQLKKELTLMDRKPSNASSIASSLASKEGVGDAVTFQLGRADSIKSKGSATKELVNPFATDDPVRSSGRSLNSIPETPKRSSTVANQSTTPTIEPGIFGHVRQNSIKTIESGIASRPPSAVSVPDPADIIPRVFQRKYVGYSRDQLLQELFVLRNKYVEIRMHSEDLEAYIDDLNMKILEKCPEILETKMSNGST